MSAPKKKIPTADFNYFLPPKLIAQKPIKPRDQARLLVLDLGFPPAPSLKPGGKSIRIYHRHFYDLADLLSCGDVLVMNNSKVIPARLIGQKETGGRVEIFLLCHPERSEAESRDPSIYIIKRMDSSDSCFCGSGRNNNVWRCLIGGKVKPGQKIILDKLSHPNPPLTARGGRSIKRRGTHPIIATPLKRIDEQSWLVAFNVGDKKLFSVGQTPLPPYIKQKSRPADYQTIYAKTAGSVAAPTAGLHFTRTLLAKLKKKGVQIEYITLHVGLGTFAPVKSNFIQDHKMHPEFATIDKATAKRLNLAKKEGRRIMAVGTTTVRALEALSQKTLGRTSLQPKSNWLNIFIYPGYKFKFIDAIITNFHLPKSTLLMLVSAFAGQKNIRNAYTEAIKKKYRFYSFGDAMMIL